MLLDKLTELNIVSSLEEIEGLWTSRGSRGEYFKESALVTADALAKIEELGEFAPLHNPREAKVIRVFEKLPHTQSM